LDNSISLGAGTELILGTGNANIGSGSNDAAGTLRVGPGGTLSGKGKIVGKVINAGGTIHPGGSPGTLTIEGDLEADADSMLQFTVHGLIAGDQYSQLVVTGNVSVAGGIQLDFENGFAPKTGDVFQLVSATGTLGTGNLQFDINGLLPGWSYETAMVGGAYQLTSLNDAVSALPGDFTGDHVVDVADYVTWRKGLDTRYTQSDYDAWRANFGRSSGGGGALNTSAVPEPGAFLLAVIAAISISVAYRKRG
jgi:hypothetical protein